MRGIIIIQVNLVVESSTYRTFTFEVMSEEVDKIMWGRGCG